MVDPSQHAQNRGWLESLLRKIPGFKGYLEQEYRRESDNLLRQHMADRLQRAKRSIDEFNLALVNAGQLDATTATEQVRTRIDKVVNRLRATPRGYSGFFDFVQKNEQSLEKVYEHDMVTLGEVDLLVAAMEKLPESTSLPAAAASELKRLVDGIDQRITQREDLLRGLAP